MGAKNVLNTATPPQSSSKFPRETTNQSQASANNAEDNLDSVHLMLEPHLRPEPLDPNSSFSKQIFDEHKELAKEYLKVCVHSMLFINNSFKSYVTHCEFVISGAYRDRLCKKTSR